MLDRQPGVVLAGTHALAISRDKRNDDERTNIHGGVRSRVECRSWNTVLLQSRKGDQ